MLRWLRQQSRVAQVAIAFAVVVLVSMIITTVLPRGTRPAATSQPPGAGGAQRPADCTPAPAAALSAIATGLRGGTHLSASGMIRDPERSNVYLVAAEIDGPSVDGAGEVGVWALNTPETPSSIFSVDSYAGQFSDWGRAPDVTTSEWELARRCVT